MNLLTWPLLSALAVAPAPQRLPFLADQAGVALAQASARHLPVFVEVWAPW